MSQTWEALMGGGQSLVGWLPAPEARTSGRTLGPRGLVFAALGWALLLPATVMGQTPAIQKALSVVNISTDNTAGPRIPSGGGVPGGSWISPAAWLTPITPQLVAAFPNRPALKPADFGFSSAGTGKDGRALTKPGGILLRDTMGPAMVDLYGVPYLFGGRRAGEGLDTVGVILNVYKKVWMDLPDSEEELATVGKLVDREAVTEGRLLTGDLAFVAALDRTTESVRLRPLLVVWPGVVMLSTRSTGKVTFARLDQFAAGLRMVRRVIPADGPLCRQTEDKFSPYLPGSVSRVSVQEPRVWSPRSSTSLGSGYLDENDPDLINLVRASVPFTFDRADQVRDLIRMHNNGRRLFAESARKREERFWSDEPVSKDEIYSRSRSARTFR